MAKKKNTKSKSNEIVNTKMKDNDKKIKKSSSLKDKKGSKSKVDRRKILDSIKSDSEFKNGIWIVLIVMVVLLIAYLVAVAVTRTDDDNNTKKETTIQYKEILVGSSFNRSQAEYIVVYYDMSDEENEDSSIVDEAVSTYSYSGNTLAMYTCDLGNSFNKKYVTKDEVNTSPTSASDLSFNGPTLIRFADGAVKEYVKGANEVKSYIESLN